MKTIFEKSQPKQKAYSLPREEKVFHLYHPPSHLLRKESVLLPEISEIDLTRHFKGLTKRNVGIDNCFYPLGSCTMKFNPRVNEYAANLPGFIHVHPLAPEETVQGNLQLIWELVRFLCTLCGMEAGSLAPNAGAQGEFAGIKMIAAYHRKRGDGKRNEILVPDSAHGTNPATGALVGFTIRSVRTNAVGDLDLEHLKELACENTAALMLTNPNTLGLFSPRIKEIASIVHRQGGLLYYDGANLNPMLNIVRPGDMGFDVMHINLHKTFSTPHGGGGPGSGPVLCGKKLIEFLPIPRVVLKDTKYHLILHDPFSIGRIAAFHGNFSIYLRAYLYAKLHGNFGLRRIAEVSVLNANYLKTKINDLFTIPFPQACMHEFIAQTYPYLTNGVKTTDIAKRMLDYGIYAPTVYFPLILKECMLIEPTESESKATLDHFIEIVKQIVAEIKTNPEIVIKAPHSTPVGRLDEVRAAKQMILKHTL